MSKNLTRKGIAFGAAFALGSTLLAGAPAFAAAELSLEPNAGTEYTMIEGETFTLKAFGNNEFLASNGAQLRVKVKNVGAASFGTFSINGTALDNSYTTAGSAGAGNAIKYTGVAGGTVAAIGTADADTAILGLGASSFGTADAVDASGTSVMTSPFTLAFTNSAVDSLTPEKLEVTVWADTDNDGVVDTGELVSPTRTVTFVDVADVKPEITAQPWAGLNSFDVSWNYGAVNEAQLSATEVGLLILNATPATPDAGVGSGLYTATLNTAKTAFTATVANQPDADGTNVALGSTVASTTFTFRALKEQNADNSAPETGDVAGADTYLKTVRAQTTRASAANSKLNVIDGTNAAIVADNSTASVRLNSEYVARFVAKDSASPAVAVSSISTTASFAVVSPLTLSATKYVAVNGTNYTTNAALAAAEVAGTTDSNGYSSVTINTVGFVAEDAITISYAAEGATDTITVTSKSPTYTLRYALGSEGNNDGYDQAIAIGGTHAVSYVVADQFGFAPANGSYNVTLARAVASGTVARTTAATWALVAPVVDGKATFNITDNGAGAGTDTLTATLVGGSVAGSAQASELSYTTAAAATPAVLTFEDNQVAASSNVAINATALPAWNFYATKGVAEGVAANNIHLSSTTAAVNADLALNGIVTNAANIGIEGVPVTISATGITFVYTDGYSKKIYSRDSIVVPTSAGGSYTVKAFSDAKGGVVTFTSTVGSLSKTTNVTFAQGAAKGLAVTAPAVYGAGRTVDVAVSVTDAAGQGVSGTAVTLKSTGAGYLNSQSGTTDANGDVNVKLITLTGDKGAAVISATATVDGKVVTKSVTVYVGVKATIVKAKNSVATVKNASGATITVVRGTKSKTVVATSNSQKVTVKGGSGTVKVYVNDTKVASK